VSEIEDQRVTQPVGTEVEGIVVFERVVEFLVDVVGGVEIVQNLGPFLFGAALVKDGGVSLAQIHEAPPWVVPVMSAISISR